MKSRFNVFGSRMNSFKIIMKEIRQINKAKTNVCGAKMLKWIGSIRTSATTTTRTRPSGMGSLNSSNNRKSRRSATLKTLRATSKRRLSRSRNLRVIRRTKLTRTTRVSYCPWKPSIISATKRCRRLWQLKRPTAWRRSNSLSARSRS